MKKILMVIVAVAGAMALSAQMPRSEWHAKVGDCALDPDALKATISQLSSEDKTAFLAEVNAAIEKMPGSDEVKAAKFLAANRAAVAGAGAADRAAVLAEVYATVPPEALTVINEEFAKNEFARPPTMTEDEFTNVVAQTMEKIVQRTSTAESGGVRAGFAGLMFVRAAGSASEATTDIVVSSLPGDVQADARNSWLPSALGQGGQASSYDSMLAPAQAGDEPNHAVVVSISPAQTIDSMLLDLQAGGIPSSSSPTAGGNSVLSPIATGGDSPASSLGSNPRDRVLNPSVPLSSLTGNPADAGTIVPNPYYGGSTRGGGSGGSTVIPSSSEEGGDTPGPTPRPYWMQNTSAY